MYTLDSGIELNRLYPDTFEIPSPNEKSKLEVGNIVKLIFCEEEKVERMWVVITEKTTQYSNKVVFQGTLDNSPVGLVTIKSGDVVVFSDEHIIQIFG